MKTILKRGYLFVLLLLIPICGFSAPVMLQGLESAIDMISLFNNILLITSIWSIIRFFWPADRSHFLLHVVNSVFTIIFYSVSLTFLVQHKNFFEGYENLNNVGCLKKYFLSTDIISLIKKLIVVAFVLNIIYIIRHRNTYYLEN